MSTEIIWTALPNSRSRTSLSLSVHVAPRLVADGPTGTLDPDFPALLSWPPPDLSFEVSFAGLPALPGTVVSAPDLGLWPILFPPTTGVTSYSYPDYQDTSIHTYPITKIAKFLQDQYAKVAIDSPESFPAISTLLANGFDDIRFSGRDGAIKWNNAISSLRGILEDNKVVDTRSSSSTTEDFVQLKDFFAPSDTDDPSTLAALTTPVAAPTLDFHAAVQFLNQHPALMRLLGLVLDVEVEIAAFAEAGTAVPSGSTTVSVEPVSELLDGVDHRFPVTHCIVGTEFVAEPGPDGGHLADGFLRFDDAAQFLPVQVEADGGGLKAVDFAGNLGTKLLNATADTLKDSAVPTLRADGFAVARLGNAQELHDTAVKQAAQNGDLMNGTLELWAEDITRGYRIDAWDSGSQAWRSLMRRNVVYELGGLPQPAVEDEAFIGTAATKKVGDDDVFLPEEVFAWDGWSLAAPRPGNTLNTEVGENTPPVISRPPNSPGPDFDARFEVTHVPGSLPVLRHGLAYRFRARTVDLAGNGLAHTSDDDSKATPPATFARLEPPQTPPVLLRTPRGPGESMETVALRSNYDTDPDPTTAQRHVVPAKVGVTTVEHWGVLEVPNPSDPSTFVLDKAAYPILADRDKATLLDHPNGDPDPKDPAGTRFYDVPEVDVTWSPDPGTSSLAFRLLDGPHAEHLQIIGLRDPSGPWYNARSIRLVIEQDTGAPSYDPSSRVLTVPLDKADVVRARLSSVLDIGDLERFGLWQWVLDALPAGPAGEAKRTELIGLIRAGQHWMFEPYRILTLVHAVRQPLLTPQFVLPLTSGKTAIGNTWTRVTRELTFSRKSTSRLDVLASWAEPVDAGPDSPDAPADIGEPGSLVVQRQTAFTIKTTHDEGDDPGTESLFHRHEFGDTKHRMVTYRAVATTRFGEFFTSRSEMSFGGTGSALPLDTGNPALGVVPGSVKVTRSVDGGRTAPLVEGVHYTVDAASGQVTFTDDSNADYPAPGDPIVVTYLVPPVTRETPDPPASGETGPQLVNVVSSAPPAAPKVVYAVPTFGWESGEMTQGGNVVGVTSTRRGGGMRVYLERPWWSSGEDEKLGVLTWPLAEDPNPPDLEDPADPRKDADARRPYVSQWGEDPIYGSGQLPFRYPRLQTFTSAVQTYSSANGVPLTLGELKHTADSRVYVAAHDVVFDASRNLWTCDVTMDSGPAYLPFVRLALARFQPSSMGSTHLSRVVLADFIQLAPDRAATVVFAGETSLTVTLAGISHRLTEGTHEEVYPGMAVVSVEQHNPDAGGMLEWTPVGDPVEMTTSMTGSAAEWTANVTLPGPRAPGAFRLVIDQFERLGWELLNKDQLANPFLVGTSDLRLVHTDMIPL